MVDNRFAPFCKLISTLLSQPEGNKEKLKDWLYRVTKQLIDFGKGTYRFKLPPELRDYKYRFTSISILPFLEKAAREKLKLE